MSDTIRVLGQVCRALCTIQNATWSRSQKNWEDDSKIHADAYATYTDLISSLAPLTEKETEALFLSSKSVSFNLSAKRKAIYLSPTSNQPRLVPVVSFECNMHDGGASMKLRMMLIQRRDDVLRGIGFRFEKGKGTHNHYHAQLIQELQGAKHISSPIVSYLDWLPESEPAIPVKAEDPVTLVLCLLISLYGLQTCYRLVTDHQISELNRYLRLFAGKDGK